MGLDYIYVKEGNKVADLIEAFKQVKDTKKAVVVHINTQKGKGYKLAEEHKEDWHYCAPFDVETGKPLDSFDGEDFSSVTAQYLLKKMKEDKKVVAITLQHQQLWDLQKINVRKLENSLSMLGSRKKQQWQWRQESQQVVENRFMEVYSTFVQELTTRSHRICASIAMQQRS